ncbi:MAG TPA: NAD(P)-dependent oxidoreductase [Caulobacteraceae bacterium]|jgi:nucleoside-diphosphate-sugar epimerase
MPSALIFGAAGQLGSALAERLLSSGWQVWAVTREGRTPPSAGARPVDGTGKSRAAVIQDLGRPVDAVFDPTAYGEADAQDLLRARAHFGGLAVVSSASVYADAEGRSLVASSQSGATGSGDPIPEGAPTVQPGDGGYAARKVALEQALLASGAPVTILRPCAIHGLHSTHPREWWFIKRALDGRRAIPVAYGGRSVFHTSSARGVAELAALCLEAPGRRVLNVADDDAPSVVQIAAAIAEATGLSLPLAPFQGAPVGLSHVGSTPWSTEHPFVLDTTAAKTLGWSGGTYRERLGETCRWVLEVARKGGWKAQFSTFSAYGYDPFDYAAEDELLAAG